MGKAGLIYPLGDPGASGPAALPQDTGPPGRKGLGALMTQLEFPLVSWALYQCRVSSRPPKAQLIQSITLANPCPFLPPL